MTLLQLHMFAVSAWLGTVAVETALELQARDAVKQHFVANVHRWVDILVEGPLVLLTLISGALLLARVWPVSPLLLFKVGAGMTAIVANFICIPLVHKRWQARDDAALADYTKKIGLTGIAIPVALVAFVIGVGFLPER